MPDSLIPIQNTAQSVLFSISRNIPYLVCRTMQLITSSLDLQGLHPKGVKQSVCYSFCSNFHTVHPTFCVVSNRAFVLVTRFLLLWAEEKLSAQIWGESKCIFTNMQLNVVTKEELINHFFPMLFLTDTIKIKVTLLASISVISFDQADFDNTI